MCHNLWNQKISRRIARLKPSGLFDLGSTPTVYLPSSSHSRRWAPEWSPANLLWEQTGQDVINRAIGQFHKRLSLVVATGGGHIEHGFEWCFWCYTYIIILTSFVVQQKYIGLVRFILRHSVLATIFSPHLYRVGQKKVSQKLMTITLSNLNGFSKFFHHSKEN